MTIYIPEPLTILLVVLSFLIGFLYRKYNDKQDIAEAYDEGFEKGAYSVIDAVEKHTGKEFSIEWSDDKRD